MESAAHSTISSVMRSPVAFFDRAKGSSTKATCWAETMYESLETLKRLPDETVLYPGHLYSPEGHDSMGQQKQSNPYLRAASVETFLSFMGH